VILGRPGTSSVWAGEVFLPMTAVGALFFWGFHRPTQAPASGRELRVTLIQPSIPQNLIWNPEENTNRFRDLIRLTDSALRTPTDLLIWPESAIPKMLRYDPETFEAVTNVAVRHHVWMIVNSDDAEPSDRPDRPEETRYYNASFLMSPAVELMARYCKRSLVIFGEYIPLQRWLPFIKWFTPVQGSFTPGTRPVPFRMPDLGVQASVLICFEDVFPGLGRDSASPGTDFLVNLTNDGWFGRDSAQWQHAASAVFRAVENGLPLVRCTNTGLTCWYDGFGRLRQVFRDKQGTIYGEGWMTAEIPLPAAGAILPRTFYNEHGDWFGWGCVGIAGLALALALVRRQ
jgi:apolipoprotein N-acyltransferase